MRVIRGMITSSSFSVGQSDWPHPIGGSLGSWSTVFCFKDGRGRGVSTAGPARP